MSALSDPLQHPVRRTEVECRRLTPRGEHWWFGYYDKFPHNATGELILGMRAAFMDRSPQEGETALIAVRREGGSEVWEPLAETRAWNWQQGCMLQWNPAAPEREILFNDREGDALVCRALDVTTRRTRVVGRAIYTVHPNGQSAISCSFPRLHDERPGYGYPGLTDPHRDDPAPAADGIWRLDLQGGGEKLIVSLAEVAGLEPSAAMRGKKHRFNHLQYSRDGERFAFLHRFKTPDEEVGTTRLLTADAEGGDIRLLESEGMVSHYDWQGSGAILAWSTHLGREAFHRYEDRAHGRVEAIGVGDLTCDGHCSFSPDGSQILNDTYPDADRLRTLFLWDWPDGPQVPLGRYYAPPMPWQIRCDLHPRWSRCGRKVVFDSIHEGFRGIYEVDTPEPKWSVS